MTNRFMVSVAALALIAGTSFANAQGSMKGGESAGSTMQHSAPSGNSAAPSQSDSSAAPSSTESSQSEQKSPGTMNNQRAEEHNKSGTTNQRAEERTKGGETNQRAEERTKGSETNQRAEERTKGSENNMKAEGRENRMGPSTAETKGERSQTTTGQAGAGAKLTSEQRTKISTVIRNEHVTAVDHVNFAVTVGTRVPREGIELRPLPAEVVTIYPEWRGYEFILVHDQIVVIDPNTYEIVEIIES
jgi:hypothetical protein